MMDAALLEKVGFRGNELNCTTVGDLIDQRVLDRPLDGNHGEIHPKASDYVEHGIPFVMATDLKNGRVDLDGCFKIPENIANGLRKGFAKTGDVLLSHKATLGRVAKVGEIKHDFIVLTPQTTYYRILKPKVLHPDYLVQYFRSQYFQDIFSLWGGSGSTRAYLGITAQKKLPIVFPPIAAQRKIAAILTAYDDLIENNRQRIALLEKMAEEIYREWFVRLRFPGHEHTPVHKGVPEGWEVGRLADVASMVFGQSPPSEHYNETGDGLPFHQGVGSYGDRFPEHNTYCSVDGRTAKAGSILFSVRAPVGRLNITDRKVILGRGLAGLNERRGRNSYLWQLLKSNFSREDLIGNGAIFASVSKKELERFPIFRPAEELIDQFQKLAMPIDQQIDGLHRSNGLLTNTRDLLLNRLISGKLRVDNLDIQFPPSMQDEAA